MINSTNDFIILLSSNLLIENKKELWLSEYAAKLSIKLWLLYLFTGPQFSIRYKGSFLSSLRKDFKFASFLSLLLLFNIFDKPFSIYSMFQHKPPPPPPPGEGGRFVLNHPPCTSPLPPPLTKKIIILKNEKKLR